MNAAARSRSDARRGERLFSHVVLLSRPSPRHASVMTELFVPDSITAKPIEGGKTGG